ncbi:MAG: transposase [Planctomycetaceae bacterium]|nr:transposase [Planctomycetaceae bacterium]
MKSSSPSPFSSPTERTGQPGRPWNPHRQVHNGILFVLRTGIPWEDLSEEFGKFKTVYNRFCRWVKSGHWQKNFRALVDHLLKQGD